MSPTRTPVLTYVYCVIRPAPGFALPRGLAGPPGLGRPRLLAAGPGRALVVSDASRARYGEAAIARGLRDLDWVARAAVAHAAVIGACLGAAAVVPVTLFTIFDSDARAVADLTARGGQVDRALRRVAGRAEWGIRIRRAAGAAPPARTPPRSGAQYLAAKRRALKAVRLDTARGQAMAARIYRRLAGRASAAVRQTVNGGARGAPTPLLLDAAFLVRASGAPRFEAAVRQAAAELDAGGFRLELTGPWPPYNFVEA